MRETNSISRLSTKSEVDGTDVRHYDRNLPQFVVVEHAPDLGAVLLAEREHQNCRTLGPFELTLGGRSCARTVDEARQRVVDLASGGVVFISIGSCGSHGVDRSGGGAFLQPLTDDGNGFARVLVGDLTHLLHRLGVNLALYLGHVDHLRCFIGIWRP